MEDKLILDTDVLVDLLRGKTYAKEVVQKIIDSRSDVITTDINAFELYFGAYKSNNEKNLAAVKGLLNSITLIGTSKDAMEIAGKIANELSKKSESIEVRDLLIGAIALVNNYAVMTKNKEHFSRVKGLTVMTP